MSSKPTASPVLLACSLMALAIGLAGCTAPAARSPLDDLPGVLGSPAQARATPQDAQAQAASPEVRPVPTAPPGGQAALKTAEDAYKRGDWMAAAREFKLLTVSYPNNGQVWFGYGASSALAGSLEEAASGFEAALRIDGRDARAAYNLSLIRLSQAEVALSAAQAGTAPATVQQEIAGLARDLGPLFNRPASGALAGAAPSGFRTQDPARDGAPASAAAALLAARSGAAQATPAAPAAAATR